MVDLNACADFVEWVGTLVAAEQLKEAAILSTETGQLREMQLQHLHACTSCQQHLRSALAKAKARLHVLSALARTLE
ncbi:MAG: hypothetical protein ABIG66_03565 [Candidatus Kerfeldbacteria bacterium]